jgi:hypothetical protein
MLGLFFMADIVRFVRIELDIPRKLRFRHKDLRDVVEATKKPIGDLFVDPFNGWPYLMLYGLRWQDLKLSLDKCSEFIDLWIENHGDEQMPMDSLGQKLLDALNASGFVKIVAEGELTEPGPEGNATPEAATP